MEFIKLNANTAFDEAISTINSTTKLVVCGSSDDLDSLEDNLEEKFSIDEIIDTSKGVVVSDWFEKEEKEYEEEWLMSISENLDEWLGATPDKQGFSLCHDVLSGDLLKDVVGVKIPCNENWEILAHLNYGGWNDCPEPKIHCAICIIDI